MVNSLFFQLREIELNGGKLTGMEREMLGLTLEANPGVTLGAALTDVFDYLGVKVKKARLEAICHRLITEHSERDADGKGAKRSQSGSFGKELIEWISGMDSADRLLTALGYDYAKAKKIYTEEDYLVTDTITSIFLKDRWNQSLIALQAAAAPWTGGKKGANANTEVIDLSNASPDDPAWDELARCFGPH